MTELPSYRSDIVSCVDQQNDFLGQPTRSWPSSTIIFMQNTLPNTALFNTPVLVFVAQCDANTTFRDHVTLMAYLFTYFEKNADIIRCFAGGLPAILLLCVECDGFKIMTSAVIGCGVVSRPITAKLSYAVRQALCLLPARPGGLCWVRRQ